MARQACEACGDERQDLGLGDGGVGAGGQELKYASAAGRLKQLPKLPHPWSHSFH